MLILTELLVECMHYHSQLDYQGHTLRSISRKNKKMVASYSGEQLNFENNHPINNRPIGNWHEQLLLVRQYSNIKAVSRVSMNPGTMGPLDIECGHDFEISSGC